ncbi:hypothetical protein CUU66_21115 [Peribacillus deserti]|uniref:Uncharacterized protein n=1 Tax=Peribacillus deserti TaxID=673318 RepID=A0A2N5M101_9BACI|nr:hypothetical protein CUU66_21115 [Peribacillus deserti]
MQWKVRDSCGSSGTGETPQAIRRGGSPHAQRKASTWNGNQPAIKKQQTLRKEPFENNKILKLKEQTTF